MSLVASSAQRRHTPCSFTADADRCRNMTVHTRFDLLHVETTQIQFFKFIFGLFFLNWYT